MKAASFELVRADSVEHAVGMLAQARGGAMLVAGAQSLGPMLNLRLAQPRMLIDITAIPALTRIEEDEDTVTLGACITTANIEDGRVPTRGLSMLPAIASRIAYRAVRNRGTIGGSVCHADPAADWVVALSALGAECLVRGVSGARRIPIERFVTGAFQTAFDGSELLDGIRIPRLSAGAGWGYAKLCRKSGEFALAIAAVAHDRSRGQFRAVIGATGGRPIVLELPRALGLESTNGNITDDALLRRVLAEHGIGGSIACMQHAATLGRALAQAGTR